MYIYIYSIPYRLLLLLFPTPSLVTYMVEAPLSGVLLAMHGAMSVGPGGSVEEDPEGTLAAAVREAMGDEGVLVMTLDLHANVTRGTWQDNSISNSKSGHVVVFWTTFCVFTLCSSNLDVWVGFGTAMALRTQF